MLRILAIFFLTTAAFCQENSFLSSTTTKIENTDYDLLCNSPNIAVDFSALGLGKIRKNFLSSSLVTCLKLASNSISEISENAFENLPNLKYLDLSYNSFDLQNNILNVNLSQIETFILDGISHTCCYDLKLNIGGFYPKLRHLFIRNSDIYAIISSKKNLPSLTHLHLSDNGITSDSFDWLPESLEYLDLTGQNLESLTLRNLKKLKWLFMDNSKNQRLLSLTLENLISLQYLSVPSNAISEISSSTFVNATSLTYLDVSSNNINYIEGGSFDSMKNLQFLNLANNYIDVIQGGTFDKLSNLQTLILEKNKITMFPMIGYKSKLKSIWLNCNSLKTIVGGTFAKMPDLEILYLHDNVLSYIDQEAFAGLENLKTLTLSNNKLASMPQNWMLPMLSLATLDLAGNNFFEFESLALSESSPLQHLYLSKQIKYIRAKGVSTLPKNVTVDIDDSFMFVDQCIKNTDKYHVAPSRGFHG